MPISARQAWKAGTAKRSTSSFGGAAVSPAGSGAGARDGMGSGSGSGRAPRSSALTISSTRSAGIGVPTIHGNTSLFAPKMTRPCSSSNSAPKGIMRMRTMRFLRSNACLYSYVQA